MSTPNAVVLRPGRTTALVVSTLLLAVGLTWTYLSMRAVMDVGGACADGGPYVSVQPCPDGAAVLISVGIPLLMIATFVGSAAAASLGAPLLLLPMWTILFGTLGYNFLEYAFTAPEGVVVGWLVCGVLFELMALPALYLMARTSGSVSIPGLAPDTQARPALWWTLYAALGGIGLTLGLASFNAWT